MFARDTLLLEEEMKIVTLMGACAILIVLPLVACKESKDPTASGDFEWVECAQDFQECPFKNKTTGPVTMRYSDGAKSYFIVSSGLDSLPCTNWIGDFVPGKTKECAYITENLLKVPVATTGNNPWKICASESGICNLEHQSGTAWVRYGSGDRWIYMYTQLPYKNLPCTADFFQIDPYRNQVKQCEWAPASADYTPKYTTCATEGRTCTPKYNETIILRYGIDGKFTYRIASIDNIPCDLTSFGHDPFHGNVKTCDYARYPYPNLETVGDWVEEGSCTGGGCNSLSKEITNGTSRTNTETTEES
jgi:hypothetical protein